MPISGTPNYYREKAEEARSQAEASSDEQTKRRLLWVAAIYVELAERAAANEEKLN